MRLRLIYLAVGIVIALAASALVYQLGFGPGRLHATLPQASTAPMAVPPVESPRPALLTAAWSGYKHRFIQPDGRVIDFQRDQVTSSEGQSYAMLRAVWMDDRPTLDLTWRWTQDNLGDPTHSRIGWLWGKAPDGSWRLLDANSASDADEDIALALLFAAHRWSSTYRPAAIALLDRIWSEEVATVAGDPYLTAGNWGPGAAGGPVLNPSYFAPYEYRIFAQEDRAHPWGELIDTSYSALQACTEAPLDRGAGRLPPNWCALDVASVVRTLHLACLKAATTDTMPSALCGGWLWTPVGISSRERSYISALTAWFCSIHGTSSANSHRNTNMTA